nr:membrane protein [Rhizobium sp. Q54]
MRFVPSLAHGVADYLVGLGMIVLAFASGAEGAGFIAYLLLGLFAIVYALLTDYELGWKPVLTLPAHLALDAAFAVAMLLLPLLFTLPVMLLWTSVAIAFMAGVLVATTKMP